MKDFSDGPVVKDPPTNAEDTGLISGLGRFHKNSVRKLLCYNYWAHAPQLLKPRNLRANALQQEKAWQQEDHALQLE